MGGLCGVGRDGPSSSEFGSEEPKSFLVER